MSEAGISLSDFTVSSEFYTDEVEACVRKWGAAVVPGWLGGDRLDELRRDHERLYGDDNPDYMYSFAYEFGRGTSLNLLKAPAGKYPGIEDVFRDDRMAALVRNFGGAECLLNYEIYATHEFKSSGLVAATHFDKLWSLKFMIYLEDVGAGNAPFGVIPGSVDYSRNKFRAIFEDNDIEVLSTSTDAYHEMGNDQIPESVGDVIDIHAPAGSLIIFDTDICHRAGYLEKGKERKVLRGHSGPSVAYSEVHKNDIQWWRGERH